MKRRRFLKYAGATAAVVGASALGLDYLINSKLLTTQPVTTQQTTAGMHLPPVIKNLQWTPTRTVNNKVYDGTVSFEADSSSPIVEAKLKFDPIYPAEIPIRAFTQEPSQSYSYTANSNPASFSQAFSNLVGGKQYRASATAKDQYGSHSEEASLNVPYVREFEKFAAKDVVVGVQYGTWWTYGAWQRPFKKTITPLLGNYTSTNPIVIDRHIDMLTGFGGNVFLSFLDDAKTDLNTSLLFDSPLIDDVSIGLAYDVPYRLVGKDSSDVNLDSTTIKNKFEADLKYLAQKYFARKNYFRIKGMPVLYLYHAGESFSGNVASIIKQIKESVRKATGFDMFLVGETVMFGSPSYNLVKPYDAVTRFGTFYNKDPNSDFPGGINNNEDNLRRLYSMWSSYSNRLGVHLIPTAMPGFVMKSTYQTILPKSTERFASQLRIGMDFLDDEIRCLFITTWNDYAENTNIEPTVQEGYSYLQTLKNSL